MIIGLVLFAIMKMMSIIRIISASEKVAKLDIQKQNIMIEQIYNYNQFINLNSETMDDNTLRQYVDEIFMIYDRDRSGTLDPN